MNKIIDLEGAQVLYDDNRSRVESLSKSLTSLKEEKVDGARVSEDGKYLYLTSRNIDVAGPYGPFSGGGGSGSDNDAKLAIINQSGDLPITITPTSSYVISFTWSSTEDGLETGPGTLSIKVNDEVKKTNNISQGYYTIDASPYLALGDNIIRITLTDIYGNIKTIAFSVKVVSYSLVSSNIWDPSRPFKGEITYVFTAKGEGTKIMHFLIDGKEIATKTINTVSREDSITLPEQSHGSHIFEAYFTTTLGTDEVKSNALSYDLICYDEDNPTTIIASSIKKISLTQYSTINIPYYVFNALQSTVDVEYIINGEVVNTLSNVDQSLHTWVKRADESGSYIFTIKSGETEKTISVVVEPVNVDIHAETQGLTLHLSSEGRSNNEPLEQRSTWQYKDIKAQFQDFNWVSDGWISDSEGYTTLRLKDSARIIIPYKPFSTSYTDIKRTGKTLEFEFATSSVFDYNTEIISCYSNGRGFKITAQQALLASSVSSINTQYKENEHVRISFVINSTADNNLIYCYINGIISGLITYPSTEIFYQNPEVNISIGSSDAVVDVYRIRIYDKALSRFQVVNNWIADMQDGEKLLTEYTRNTIYDDSDLLSLDKIKVQLPKLPYIVVYTDKVTDKKGNLVGHLPTYKGEKLLVSGYYVDPVNAQNSFSWKNGEIDVQGTSSQAYPIKNFKLKIKRADTYLDESTRKVTDCSGFIMTQRSEEEGTEVTEKKYPLRGYDEKGNALSIKENTFVFKADYASSEGCNNVELVRFYNDVCTQYIYKTPPQEEDSKVRQGIDGFPMVWFEEVDGEIKFIGKYNFNNHKGTEDTYGLTYHGETFEETDESDYYRSVVGSPDESWEVTDNNNDIALWKRVAGDSTKTLLKDVSGKTVTYDLYISGDNLTSVKEKSLSPLYEGTYTNIDNENYAQWVLDWKAKYTDLESWITNYAVLSINDSGEGLDSSVRAIRDFIINTMKRDIVSIFSLTETSAKISPEDDMLGEYAKGESVAHAFEVRFPSEWYDAHTDSSEFPEVVKVDRFVELQKWVVSTDPSKATNEALSSPVKYSGVEYTTDSETYRLAKFKSEFSNYFNLADTLFYYIYTETFLMIDSRVKNSFPSYFAITHKVPAKEATTGEQLYEECEKKDIIEEGVDYFKRTGNGSNENPYVYTLFEGTIGNLAVDDEGNKLFIYLMTEEEDTDKNGRPLGRWCWLPYDMDTGIGINNEGLLVFDYSLEDTEALIGSKVVKIGEEGSEDGVAVFNGASSVLWNNVRKCFANELAAMYVELRNGALYNYSSIEQRYEDHQYMWPAAIFNEDAYYKYIKPLLETGEDRLGMCLGSKEQQRKYWLFNRFRFLDSKYVAGDAVKNRINFRVNDLSGDKTIKITPYIDLYIKVKQGEAWESTPTKVYRNQELPVFVDVPQAGDTEAYIYSADQIKEIKGLNQSLHISTLDISSATNLQHLDVSSTDSVKGNSTLSQLALGANTLLRSIDARNCRALGDTTQKYYTTIVDLSKCEQLEEAYFNGSRLATVKLPEGGRLRTIYLPSSITTLNIENQEKITDIQILDFDGNWDVSNIETLIISNVNLEVQLITLDIIDSLREGSFLSFKGFDFTLDSKEKFEKFIDKLYKLKSPNSEDTNTATVQGTVHLPENIVIDYDYYKQAIAKFRDLKLDVSLNKKVEFYDYTGSQLLDVQYTVENSSSIGKVTYTQSTPIKNDIEKIHYVFDGWSREINGELDENVLNNITSNMKVYAHFQEIPIYYVSFYNYDGSYLFFKGHTFGKGSIKYEGTTPTYEDTKFGKVAFEGWGTVKYGTVNVTYEESGIPDVEKDEAVYAIMDWPILSFEVTKNPNRLNYWPKIIKDSTTLYEGDIVDLEGLEVTATKSTPNGDQVVVLPTYEYSPKTNLTYNDKNLIISLVGRVEGTTTTLTKEVPLHYVTKVGVTKDPERSVFFTGEEYTPIGIELEFTFDQGETEKIAPTNREEGIYNWTPAEVSTEKSFNAEVTYKGWTVTPSVFGVKEVVSFEDADWDTISAISKEGLAPNWWSIGDYKTIVAQKSPRDCGASDTIVWNTNIARYRIIDFDHNMGFESPGRHTITIEFSGFKPYILGFEKVDTLPTSFDELPEGTTSKLYIIKNETTGEDTLYDAYFYNKSTNLFKYKVGTGTLLTPAQSPYNVETLTMWIESAYTGSALSTPSDGTTLSGIKYSWNKGCSLRSNCNAFIKALPEDLQKVLVEVTKGQRDQELTQYPLTDSGVMKEFEWTTVNKTQKDTVYIASWMELTGMKRSGVTNTGDVVPADESEVCTQFEYYKQGGADRRIRIKAEGNSSYTFPYATRSFEGYRYIAATPSMSERFINYYSWVDYTGNLQSLIWSYSDSLASLIPIFTV